MSKGKKVGLIVGILAIVILLIIVVASNMLFSFSLKTDSPFSIEKMMMKQFKNAGGNTASAVEYSGFAGSAEERSWFEESNKSVYIESDDSLKLHAYQIENNKSNGKYVIVCHGYTSNASQMARYIKHFYDNEYSILAPDARAHGKSEGTVRGMGWPERRDIIKWANFLIDENSNVEIALFGVSMGGATVMMTSGESDLPKNVKVIVEDCGYSSVWDEFSKQMGAMFHLPTFPLLNTASITSKLRGGPEFKEASAVNQLKNCTTPILFIHGSADDFVPFSMLDVVFNAATCEKQKLVVEGAGHAGSSTKDPELYWNTVDNFVKSHIN